MFTVSVLIEYDYISSSLRHFVQDDKILCVQTFNGIDGSYPKNSRVSGNIKVFEIQYCNHYEVILFSRPEYLYNLNLNVNAHFEPFSTNIVEAYFSVASLLIRRVENCQIGINIISFQARNLNVSFLHYNFQEPVTFLNNEVNFVIEHYLSAFPLFFGGVASSFNSTLNISKSNVTSSVISDAKALTAGGVASCVKNAELLFVGQSIVELVVVDVPAFQYQLLFNRTYDYNFFVSAVGKQYKIYRLLHVLNLTGCFPSAMQVFAPKVYGFPVLFQRNCFMQQIFDAQLAKYTDLFKLN